MARRRMTRRRRTTRKRTASRKTIAKIAKAVVLRNTDRKDWHNTTGSFTPVLNTLTDLGNAMSPTNIATTIKAGQQDSARVGTIVRIKRIRFGIQINPGTSVPLAWFRLLLVRSPRNMGSGITVGDILEWSNTTDGAFVSEKQQDSTLQILYDKLIPFGIQQRSSVLPYFHHTINFKNPLKVTYLDTSTGGVAADINGGMIRWYYLCSDNTGSVQMIHNVYFYEN